MAYTHTHAHILIVYVTSTTMVTYPDITGTALSRRGPGHLEAQVWTHVSTSNMNMSTKIPLVEVMIGTR